MKLKVLEYNILNGLCTEKLPYKIQENRLKKVCKIIETENPDILILCEGFFWPFAKKENLKKMSEIFKKMYFSYAPSKNNFRWAPIVLSKFPISEFKILSKPYLNLMRVNFKIKGKNFILDVFHPHPDTTEDQKKDFLQKIIKKVKGNYILTGDFNTFSLEDKYDKKKLIKGYEKFMFEKGKGKVEDMLKGRAIQILLDNGLRDTYREMNNGFDFTVPTNFRDKIKNSASRMDYIFCSKNFKILEAGVIKNKFTEKASDHYPIYAHLEI